MIIRTHDVIIIIVVGLCVISALALIFIIIFSSLQNNVYTLEFSNRYPFGFPSALPRLFLLLLTKFAVAA
jgi:hypothetical protein